MKKIKKHVILVPFAEGFEESEAIIAVDLMRRAEAEVIMAGCSALEVKSARNVKVLCDTLLSDVNAEKLTGVVLPGGIPGTTNLMKDTILRNIIIDLDRQNLLVGAVCAAPTVLYAAGILAGRKVTSHPSVAKEFSGCLYSEDRVVCDGNVITSRGVGTSVEFALALVENLTDKDRATAIAKAIVCQ
ncbi:MAG: DJ-1/PfpI family protein [Fibrobacteres bacterium]|nr:DJ-1/PfpI family protein [Fibrobacterota bacterium]